MFEIIHTAITFMLFCLCLFLGYQHLKKFGYMQEFIRGSNQLVEYLYMGTRYRKKRGMKKIVLRGQRPFKVLVGFYLQVPVLHYAGFDYYGFAESDNAGVLVIETYFGKGSCLFQFYSNQNSDNNPIVVSSTEEDQNLRPTVSYPPHWYQRFLGFYG